MKRLMTAWAGLVLVILILASVTAIALLVLGLNDSRSLAAVLAVPVAILVPLFGRTVKTSLDRARFSTPEQRAAALEMLAERVSARWHGEADTRRILDPIPVRWRLVSHGAGHDTRAAPRFWRSDRIDQLTRAFNGLERRRLLILGGPGSGKTTLAVLLTVDLCRRRQAGSPVPVLLTIGTWDPTAEHPQDWMERRLLQEYPALRDSRAYGPTAAHDLIESRLVLPVIDGLDELSESRARLALDAVHEHVPSDYPLILTCRTDSYRAVSEVVGELPNVGVIEPESVRAEDAIAFLCRGLSRTQTDRWRPVFAALSDPAVTPLSTAMAVPLNIWLARVVYREGSTSPVELTDASRFGDTGAIERYLMKRLIPTIFKRANERPAEARTRRRWNPEDAERWLAYLAVHMHRLETRDLTWWHLHYGTPAVVLEVITYTIGLGLVFGLGLGLVYGPPLGFLDVLIAGLSALLFAGLILGLVPGDASRREATQGSRWSFARGLAMASLVALVVGLVSGSGIGLLSSAGWSAGLEGGIEFAIMYALVGGVTMLLLYWMAPTSRLISRVRRRRSRPARSGLSRVMAHAAMPLLRGIEPSTRRTRMARRLGVRLLVGAAAGLTAGLGVVLVNVLLRAFEYGPRDLLMVGLGPVVGFGLMNGLAVGLLVALAPARGPARIDLELSGRRLVLARWLVYGLGMGLGVAFLIHLAFGLGSGAGYGWELDIGAKLHLATPSGAGFVTTGGPPAYAVSGPLIGVLIGVVKWAHTAINPRSEMSPRSTVENDRAFTLVVMVLLVPAVGVTTIPTIASPSQFGLALRFGLEYGLLFALARPWSHYTTARLWLFLRGQLPWRLMTFLEDAHKLQIVRQVGAIYQFRHSKLQDHLVRSHDRSAA